MKLRLVCVAVVGSALALTAGCREETASPPHKVRTVVSVLPLRDFVTRVAGRHAEVEVLVGPGQEPHSYEPTPKQVAAALEADLYFKVGLPLEKRVLEKITAMNPKLKVIDLTQGIRLRMLTEGEEEHESGGHGDAGHQHVVGEPDPHIWLSPKNARTLCASIGNGLRSADPAHAAEYDGNLKAFDAELARLDAKIEKALAPFKGKEFMVFHPAFGYFGDAYGLKQVPVEIEGKEPSAQQLAALVRLARERDIKIIFVQPQFSDKSARAVAQAIGGAVLAMDDLGPDYLKNMTDIAEKIEKALAKP
jgi:zinc transport system substrate-binding protein